MLCQFSAAGGGRATLADFVPIPDVYPAGRLDADSEGLVVLTADGVLQARITSPRGKLAKVYWAEVEGSPTREQQRALERASSFAISSRRRRRRAPSRRRQGLWPRDPPIRVRKSIPTAWLELTLTEGRNRQVRRMTAAVGLPTLRLIRYAIGPWTLDGLAPGAWRSGIGERSRAIIAARSMISRATPSTPARRLATTPASFAGFHLRRSPLRCPDRVTIRRLFSRFLSRKFKTGEPRIYGPSDHPIRRTQLSRGALEVTRKLHEAGLQGASSSAARSATCCSGSSRRISTSRPTHAPSR